jgi:hypothetical protein
LSYDNRDTIGTTELANSLCFGFGWRYSHVAYAFVNAGVLFSQK